MIVRGSTVRFSATFTDDDGEPAVPDVAVVTISYIDLTTRRRVVTSNYLQPGDSPAVAWVYDWDSAVARKCMVRWSIKAGTNENTLKIADDGEFCLEANSANIPPTATSLVDESGNLLVTETGEEIIV